MEHMNLTENKYMKIETKIILTEEGIKIIKDFIKMKDPCKSKGCSLNTIRECCGCSEYTRYKEKREELEMAGLFEIASEFKYLFEKKEKLNYLEQEIQTTKSDLDKDLIYSREKYGAITSEILEMETSSSKQITKSKYDYMIGKMITCKDGSITEVIEVHPFKEDTFGQGNYAVTTKDGRYLYECEIKIQN